MKNEDLLCDHPRLCDTCEEYIDRLHEEIKTLNGALHEDVKKEVDREEALRAELDKMTLKAQLFEGAVELREIRLKESEAKLKKYEETFGELA